MPVALPLILYAVHCYGQYRLYYMLCTATCLCHGHCCLYCMLCTAACLCHRHCCLYCMLCTATCLCHKHCTVTVSCLLWHCCLTLYVVHTLPPGFPLWALLLYMEYYVMLCALRMCCHMTHYWVLVRYHEVLYQFGVKLGAVNYLTWIKIVGSSGSQHWPTSLFCQPSLNSSSFKVSDNCVLVQLPVMFWVAQFTPNYAKR